MLLGLGLLLVLSPVDPGSAQSLGPVFPYLVSVVSARWSDPGFDSQDGLLARVVLLGFAVYGFLTGDWRRTIWVRMVIREPNVPFTIQSRK